MTTLFKNAAREDSGLKFEFTDLLTPDEFFAAILCVADSANQGFARAMALTKLGYLDRLNGTSQQQIRFADEWSYYS
ncbi:MAG: hypothetical protein ACI8Z1_000246 [Candidatus Azotimanducaceae bacterium]|jgi:hypothetical protein